MRKTKAPARNARRTNNSAKSISNENFLSQYDDDYWHSMAGGEKREKKKKIKMKVSGKSVLKLAEIIKNKA